MKYHFDNHRMLRTPNGKWARFWTTQGAKKAVIKTANEKHIDFVATCVLTTRYYPFKNRLAVLVQKDDVYNGEPMINVDGTPNRATLDKMKHDYNVEWK